MSLPLKDVGSVKISEAAHSYLRALALSKNIDLVALIRQIVETKVIDDFHVFSMAQDIHSSKQLGAIAEDLKG